MGLLDKSLKKTGKERGQARQPANERAVGWLSTSLGERASALADKVDLEGQYSRLEGLAASAPQPPKVSLRDRARRLLGTSTPPPVRGTGERPLSSEPPRKTLRERAAMLVKRFGGTGGDTGSGAPPAQGDIPGADRESGRKLAPLEPAAESPSSVSSPAPGSRDAATAAETLVAAQPHELEESPSPLADFTETIGRITENLKNLQGQLDRGNFLRDVQVPQQPAAAQPQQPSLFSNHVPLPPGGMSAGTEAPRAAGGPAAAPQDVFWPRNLPLDLPARDVRINPDGSTSVVPGPLQLPFLAEDIAPPDSELSHFTRNLKNAELFIGEGELQLSRAIYERLLKQIVDEDARRKMRANLEALDQYRKSHEWGNFMPMPQWMRNPLQQMQPSQISVSEMPVEAKSITINIDKGFFDVARAAFEKEQKEAEAKKEPESAATGAQAGDEEERRASEDRRQGLPDMRGEGAEERRSGADRREAGEAAKAAPAAEAMPAPAAAAAGEAEPAAEGVMEPPRIPGMSPDGQAVAPEEPDEGGSGEEKPEENKVQEIRGVLELKTPEQEDTPFLTLTYDFTKIPHAYRLAKDNGIFEYAYYKYKPMLVKAHQFIKRKQITRALNYYRVIREQQIPTEFRHMVDRNIKDITEYLQKYLVTRQN